MASPAQPTAHSPQPTAHGPRPQQTRALPQIMEGRKRTSQKRSCEVGPPQVNRGMEGGEVCSIDSISPLTRRGEPSETCIHGTMIHSTYCSIATPKKKRVLGEPLFVGQVHTLFALFQNFSFPRRASPSRFSPIWTLMPAARIEFRLSPTVQHVDVARRRSETRTTSTVVDSLGTTYGTLLRPSRPPHGLVII